MLRKYDYMKKEIKNLELHHSIKTFNIESKNARVVKTKNGRIMLLSKCEMCDSKKIKIYQRAKS